MKIGDVILDPKGEPVELLDIYPDKGMVRVAYKDTNGYFTIHMTHPLVYCKQIMPIAGRKVTLLPDEDWVPFKGETNDEEV